MTDSAPPQASSPAALAAVPVANRWARLWGLLKRFRGPIVAIAAFGAVLSGLLGYWRAYETVHTVVVPKPAPAAVTADAGPLSVVVLPFQNLTGDASQAYVADGLTASLTADLSRIREAFVVNAATAFAYKDKPVTAQQVAKDLGVRFVLQGSVQRNGNKIRINAQLANANSNAQLWSDSFEGDQSDLFALQDQVTARIGNSIGREMVIVAARESETRKSSPKVADLILRARALQLRRDSLKNLLQIEDLDREALSLEPSNLNAMVDLAVTLSTQVLRFGDEMDASAREKKLVEAYALALKAKELDPDNPRVYTSIAMYKWLRHDWEGTRRANETALALAPKNPAAYNNLAFSLLNDGEPRKAIELLTRAIELDPRHPHELNLSNMGWGYFMLGDNDAAIEWYQKSLEINPGDGFTYASLAMAYALKGEDAKARAAASEARRLNPSLTLSSVRKESSSNPDTYKEWFESKYVPAWRKAGLPE